MDRAFKSTKEHKNIMPENPGQNLSSGDLDLAITLLQPKGKKNLENSVKPFFIDSRDCLKDYHKLLALNLQVISKPDYTEQGLSATFIDGSGNIITLLEKRNYLEN